MVFEDSAESQSMNLDISTSRTGKRSRVTSHRVSDVSPYTQPNENSPKNGKETVSSQNPV